MEYGYSTEGELKSLTKKCFVQIGRIFLYVLLVFLLFIYINFKFQWAGKFPDYFKGITPRQNLKKLNFEIILM